MVAIIEPQVLDEPDRLGAGADQGDFEIDLAATGGDEHHRAHPHHGEAEDIGAQDDEKREALADHHPTAGVEMDELVLRTNVRENGGHEYADEPQPHHDATPYLLWSMSTIAEPGPPRAAPVRRLRFRPGVSSGQRLVTWVHHMGAAVGLVARARNAPYDGV